MKEFDNLINNAKISEIQDYRYFEKFAKQLEFKDLSGKDIETIKQLKDCIETININNRVVGEKNLELEDTIKQLHEQIEAMLKADKITIVKYGPDCAEGFDDMVRMVKQLQNQIPLKKIEAITPEGPLTESVSTISLCRWPRMCSSAPDRLGSLFTSSTIFALRSSVDCQK